MSFVLKFTLLLVIAGSVSAEQQTASSERIDPPSSYFDKQKAALRKLLS